MNAPNTCLRIEETIRTPWCEEDDSQKRWIKQKITMLRNNLTFITMWLCSSYIIPGFHGRGWKFFCLVSIQLNFFVTLTWSLTPNSTTRRRKISNMFYVALCCLWIFVILFTIQWVLYGGESLSFTTLPFITLTCLSKKLLCFEKNLSSAYLIENLNAIFYTLVTI